MITQSTLHLHNPKLQELPSTSSVLLTLEMDVSILNEGDAKYFIKAHKNSYG